MLVFPQMTTGSVASYPLTRKISRRTVVNRLLDGSAVTYTDPDWVLKQWDLECVGLSAVEWGSVQSLFDSVAGRLGTFTLLEPAGNLLAQSEDFSATEWDKSALVSVTGGISDPVGGMSAGLVTNAGPTAGNVAQTLAVPGGFQYAVSVWVRMSAAGAVALFAGTTGGGVERSFEAGTVWRRVVMPVGMELATESVTFGVRLGAGVAAELFGMQVEAQAGAGGYQKTGANGGVHSQARFGSDVLTVRARGTDVFDAAIRIVSKGS